MSATTPVSNIQTATPTPPPPQTTTDWANQEVSRYLLANVLPTVDPFCRLDTIPESFSNIEAVKTFVAILNINGYHYRVRNTKKEKGGNNNNNSNNNKDKAHYISYRCTLCNKPLAFSKPKCSSSSSSIVRPTKGSSLCNCPRGPKSGNRLQRFPKQETDTALASLLRAGVTDVLSECDDTITRVLREECGLVLADTVLASRVKEEYEKENIFLDNSHNNLVRKFADYVTAYFKAPPAIVEVCGNNNSAEKADTCFVLSQQPQPEVTAVYIVTKRSQKRAMDHFAAFVAGAATPFAWGSALIREDARNNGQWFEGRVRAATCEVAPAVPITFSVASTPEVQRILSSDYNAFGLAMALFVHCTGIEVCTEDVLSAQVQAGSPQIQGSTTVSQQQQQQQEDADAYAQMIQYSYIEQQQQQQQPNQEEQFFQQQQQQMVYVPQFYPCFAQGPDGTIYNCYTQQPDGSITYYPQQQQQQQQQMPYFY